ncbi:tape measure protein [Deinococcus lacus]|uniref:Tape measure protein n=1 Tax=Deinococcus lacus TaxID=392561 RepID=A0ABW1YE76_9DEIO
MTSAAVEWQLRLIDKVTAPARRMLEMADRLERRITSTDRQADRLARTYDEASRAGVRSAQQVDRAYAKTESRLARVKAVALTAGKALVGLGAIGAGAAVKAALGGMSGREGNLQSLGTLLKTNDQAQVKSAAAWIGQFADVTPFEDPAVMGAVKQLLASQFSFDDTKWLATITGDAASALGNDAGDAQFKWEIINRALGQIKAKGRVQGDELLQLQEAGIGTNAYLEKYVGKNYRDLMQKGQLSATAGLNAILKGLYEDYGGSMDKMSKTFSGLASTLASRPKRILAAMFDQGGLDQPKKFMENLVNLTDFSKEPGKRILERLSGAGARIMNGLFGPLANATEGDRATQLVDRLLNRFDAFAAWTSANGPTIRAFFDGFGGGLNLIWGIIQKVAAPFEWLFKKLGLIGENDPSGLAKTVGYLLGAGLAVKLLAAAFFMLAGPVPMIVTLFTTLSMLSAAVPMLVRAGVLSAGTGARIMAVLTPLTSTVRVFAVLTGGLWGKLILLQAAGARLLTAFLHPFVAGWSRLTRLLAIGGWRSLIGAVRGAAAFASRIGWLGRLVALLAGANPLVLAIVAGVAALAGLGIYLYKNFEPFRNWVDSVGATMKGWGRSALEFGKNLWDGVRKHWNNLPNVVKVGLGVLFPPLGIAMALADSQAAPLPIRP